MMQKKVREECLRNEDGQGGKLEEFPRGFEYKKPPLRIEEFATATKYKVPTIRKKIHRREIDYIKCGRLILIPASEVDRLLSDFRPRVEL